MAIDVYVSYRDGRNALISGVTNIKMVDQTMFEGDVYRDIFDASPYLVTGGISPSVYDVDYPPNAAGWTQTYGHTGTGGPVLHFPLSDDFAHVAPRQQMITRTLVIFTLAANDPNLGSGATGIFFFAKQVVGISTAPPSG